MAPEQFQNRGPNRKTDVYALTAVLFEVLSLSHYLGYPRPLSPEELVRAIQRRDPLAAYARPDSEVPDMIALCRAGLAKSPAKRIESVETLADGLRGWLNSID